MSKAKSNGETGKEHIKKCLNIFSQLRGIYPDLDVFLTYPFFYDDVFHGLFFHDFGKETPEFIKGLSPEEKSWSHRHEILSIPFINYLSKEDTEFIKLLVLTHHKDINHLLTRHSGTDYNELLKEMRPNISELNQLIKTYPVLAKKILKSNNYKINPIEDLPKNGRQWEEIAKSINRNIRLKEYNMYLSKLGIFGKGMMNACDYSASAGIKKILKPLPLPTITKVYNFKQLTSIQKKCLSIKGDTIAISPTGSGKTEAGLFWASYNLDKTKGNRVFYNLPYTASINAMYKRLLEKLSPCYLDDDICISLLHGKATYFLYKMFEEKKFKDTTNILRKIYSPYKIMTPFQCLKHFFSLKGYEMGLLEMYRGRFIFDEIHAYDTRTTGLILSMCEYLKEELDAKILIMSATLPDFLKDMFIDSLHIKNEIRMERRELDTYLRHRLEIVGGDIFRNIHRIRKRLRNRERVLIVCNTVKQAQRVYDLLKDEVRGNSALIHGKFILEHREEIEEKIEEIEGKRKLDLLVGTQVIEVSLDISYDVCFSEPAPIDALIQRFGRVNRRRNGICDVIVFSKGSEDDEHIYSEQLVDKTLKVLSNGLLYEHKLYDAVNEVYSTGFTGDDNKLFEKTRKGFRRMTDDIVPFKNSNKRESDFYKLFESINVVPVLYRKEYLECMKNKKYFDVKRYYLQVSNRQYYRLLREGRIEDEIFINAKYDAELGLRIDELQYNPDSFSSVSIT